MAYIYSLADTWNDGATTFKGISLNVTDSASAAGSLLMDLQVGGVSQFRVTKAGAVTVASTLASSTAFSPVLALGTGVGTGLVTVTRIDDGNINFGFGYDGTNRGAIVASNGSLRWGSSGITSPDLFLVRDAANTLAQRNGVNAQAFNIYNTFTDASNYERGFMRWNSNELLIGTEAAGTGTLRDVRIGNLNNSGNVTGRRVVFGNTTLYEQFGYLYFVSSGNGFDFNTALRTSRVETSQHLQFAETTAPAAPAANSVRIYAEDNGSGKTRLMALFPTGVAQQIAIEP
jgi:hypothetical protein